MTYRLERQKKSLPRFLKDSCGNEEERSALIRRLQYHYRDELTFPNEDIEAEDVSRVIVTQNQHLDLTA